MSDATYCRSTYDVVIIGARCAGAATAFLLARQGLRVLLVEKGRRGSDTLSTHALMRGAVLQLHRWGLLDAVIEAGTPPVSTTTFHYGRESVEIAIKPRDGIDALFAPRRTVLDPILEDAAAESGAEIIHGSRLVDLVRGTQGRVRGVILEDRLGDRRQVGADLAVGADGVRSTVARLVNASTLVESRHSTGVVYTYWEGVDLPGYHWYFGPELGSGSIATNGGTLVFSAASGQRFRNELRFKMARSFFEILEATAPEMAAALPHGRRVGSFRGYAGRPGYLRQCWGSGWALVGDSGYFKDPATAHGITDALRDAELLARAVVRGTTDGLADYQRTRDELSLRLFQVTDAIASFELDSDQLQQKHREMSDEMRREVQFLAALDNGSRPIVNPVSAHTTAHASRS